MNDREFLNMIEEVIAVDPGTLDGTETLDQLGWDSLAVLVFIATVDERFGLDILPKELNKCKTVSDLKAMLGDRVSVG